ncbi:hypothetical protein GCM10011345_09490 [Gemmobacter megaterium]|nr:hypothetical protein [Gemmobacter megaterium]GGE06084.1 hypothetical protein GCM10011345_09490 [Gemmobacter megaterium]
MIEPVAIPIIADDLEIVFVCHGEDVRVGWRATVGDMHAAFGQAKLAGQLAGREIAARDQMAGVGVKPDHGIKIIPPQFCQHGGQAHEIGGLSGPVQHI